VKNGIALLITLMFVIVITVAIGYGLKQVNEASQSIKDEQFLYQSSAVIEDVINMLKHSKDLQEIVKEKSIEKKIEKLNILLSQASVLPLQTKNLNVVIKFSSARAKLNPTVLHDKKRLEKFRLFCSANMISPQYADILVDNISGVKGDNSYNSEIFNENHNLFRNYIASEKHLKKINSFYTQEYSDNSLKNIDFTQLFYLSEENATKIDLNYATPEVWELLTGVSKERAETLTAYAGAYENDKSLDLSDEEFKRLKLFAYSYFEPILVVKISIQQHKNMSTVQFEYDIRSKKGSNFVFTI